VGIQETASTLFPCGKDAATNTRKINDSTRIKRDAQMRRETYSGARQEVGGRFHKFLKKDE
jgi:hypothetical protein